MQQLLIWMSGSTYHATPAAAITVALAAAGVNVPAARLVLVLLSAILTALATLLIGPLSFVGLLAPHLAAMLGARRAGHQLVSAALIGAAVMPAADWLGRQIMFPYEVPAGMTATLLGGAYFMFMMRRM